MNNNNKILKTSQQNFDKWWNAKHLTLYHYYEEDRYNEIMKAMASITEKSGILKSSNDDEVYQFCVNFVQYCSQKTGEHKGLLADFVEYLSQ